MFLSPASIAVGSRRLQRQPLLRARKTLSVLQKGVEL
jgi:hypothetical protein